MGTILSENVYVLSGTETRTGYAGGVFFAIACAVLERGGAVVGAAYREDFLVEHVEVRDKKNLRGLTGVKYAESRISEELKGRIRARLEAGRHLLFAGSPCQVEEVYRYLGREYTCFYTIAVGCHGVIRERVWKDYIAKTQANKSRITEIHVPYRGEFGISQEKVLVKFSHGTAYFRDGKQDSLMRLREAGLIWKEKCYACPWTEGYGKADLLLNVYYEAGRRDAVQEKGLTRACVWTDKGRHLLDLAAGRLLFHKRAPAAGGLFRKKPSRPENYGRFWDDYGRYGFSFAAELMDAEADTSLRDRALLDFYRQQAALYEAGISIGRVLRDWGLENVKAEEFPILPSLEAPGQLSLRCLVGQVYEARLLHGPAHVRWNEEKQGLEDLYLITGAQFENKGAQSMLFTAVSELKRRHPACDIYYLPIDSMKQYPDSAIGRYRFHILRDGMHRYSTVFDLLPHLKAVVDVSGYTVSSNWDSSPFIRLPLLAKGFGVPIYFMPQSFGPLDFEEELDQKIREVLAYASVVFAREKSGYDLLTGKYGLKNVRLARDMVLQNKGLMPEHIYTVPLRAEDYRLETDGNVAVVPNVRNYEFGNREELLEVYRRLITELLKKGRNVYLIAHSADERACRDLYELFLDHTHVFLYQRKLDCLEFGLLAREFCYLIASRYHAVVHAYKEGIPCVAIGWAEKYRELLTLFGQERYGFDVRSGIDAGELVEAVLHMDAAWRKEQERIREILPALQTENCFDAVD